MSVIAGVRQRKNAERNAKQIEKIAEHDAELMRAAAEDAIADSEMAPIRRGVSGRSQTALDLTLQNATLEGIKIDRHKYRAAVMAYNMRIAGRQAQAQGIGQSLSVLTKGAQTGFTMASYLSASKVARDLPSPTTANISSFIARPTLAPEHSFQTGGLTSALQTPTLRALDSLLTPPRASGDWLSAFQLPAGGGVLR